MIRVDIDSSGDDKRVIKLADMQLFDLETGEFMCIHTPTQERGFSKNKEWAITECIDAAFWHVPNAIELTGRSKRSLRRSALKRLLGAERREMDKLFVIYWRYSDGSGCGVVRVYETKERADADLQMLQQQAEGMRTFALSEVEYIDV